MRISDWSSDVYSSDLGRRWSHERGHAAAPCRHRHTERTKTWDLRANVRRARRKAPAQAQRRRRSKSEDCSSADVVGVGSDPPAAALPGLGAPVAAPRWARSEPAAMPRSEEHTSELQSLMR